MYIILKKVKSKKILNGEKNAHLVTLMLINFKRLQLHQAIAFDGKESSIQSFFTTVSTHIHGATSIHLPTILSTNILSTSILSNNILSTKILSTNVLSTNVLSTNI
jgi:hypothetical protein